MSINYSHRCVALLEEDALDGTFLLSWLAVGGMHIRSGAHTCFGDEEREKLN